MTDAIEENVLLVAYTEPADAQDWPVVDVYLGEVLLADDGTYEGVERGPWWNSEVLDAGEAGIPATLDNVDTELTSRGYTRTSGWNGPKDTNRGERYVASALARVEAVR